MRVIRFGSCHFGITNEAYAIFSVLNIIRRATGWRSDYGFSNLKGDMFGGVVSAIMMVPVALGFGALSGLGPVAAFYGAIAVGLFTAAFGGAAPMISGPSALITIFTAIIISSYADSLAEAFTIVMMAGLFQIAFGLLRLGRFANWLPFPVVRGVFIGVGAYIFLTQTLWFLGAPIEPGIGLFGIIASWPEALLNLNIHALAVAIITLSVFILWPDRFHRFVPDALVALITGALAGVFLFDSAPRLGDTPIGLPEIQIPVFHTHLLIDAIQPALILAFLSSMYNLLTALIIDPLTGRTHQSNRELVGLGLGNIVTGALGGLPGAASAPCSLLAARAGGRTAITGMVCAAVLLAVLFGLGRAMSYIPLAAFAGILIKVGWDMMDIRFLRRIPRLSPDIGIVALLTAFLSLVVDVISAIAVGFIVSGMANALRFQSQQLNQTVSTPLLDMVILPDAMDDPDFDPFRARVGLLSLRGSYSIASAREIVRVISPDLADHEIVIFDFSETTGMDDSAAMAVEDLINSIVRDQDKICIVSGLSDNLEETLSSLGIFDNVPKEDFAKDMDEAHQIAARILQAQS